VLDYFFFATIKDRVRVRVGEGEDRV